jgi:hypothetical protein
MTGPDPAVVSTGIGALVRGPERDLVVLAAFPQAAYLTSDDGDVVAIVTSDGVRLPNAAVLTVPAAERPLAGLHAGQVGSVGVQRLRIGGLDLRAARWWDPRPRLAAVDEDVLARAAVEAGARIGEVLEPLPVGLHAPLAAAAAGLREGDRDAVLAAARQLLGAGPGLTPAGDDLLAGLVSGTVLLSPALASASGGDPRSLRVLRLVEEVGPMIAAAARDRTTALSAALLGHAARGEVAAPAGAFLHALGGRGVLTAATDRLLQVGATSGRDLAVGLLAAVDLILSSSDRAPTVLPGRDR